MELVNDSPRVLGNRYEVGELLGRGGMAEVHLGRDARLGRAVAIKLLRTDLARDSTFQARFRREAQSAAALNHPAIVAVYDTGEEQVVESGGAVFNLPYIVMEHIEGRTLRDVLNEGHHLEVDAALDIITGVLTALEYSHRIGIVHRDIKPANVMLTPVGDVKVMDFGIARAMSDASSTMTQTQAVIGTAQYLSPEQARGEQVDTRSDLYSAGCLLYELLTGRPPFVADSPVAVAYQHVREAPVPPSRLIPGIPDSVDRIVLHSLAKGRDERYQTAADFRADVEAARGGQQVSASVPAMHGSNATTQYVPVQDQTGTRIAPAVGMGAGSLLGVDPTAGQGGPADPYDPYAQSSEGGGRRQQREQEPSSNRNVILAGLATVIVVALVAFFAYTQLGDKQVDPVLKALPNVVGSTQAVAEQKLTAAGFEFTVTEEKSEDAQEGKVTGQNPPAAGAVDTSTAIALTVGTGTGKVTVPDVNGMTQAEAIKALDKEKLALGGVDYDESSASLVPKEALRSSPAADTEVEPGSMVKLVFPSQTVPVPEVAGKTESAAKSLLNKAGLKMKTGDSEVNGEVKAGRVLRTDPDEGSTVPRGSTVTVVLAEAPAVVTTPPTTAPTTPVVSPTSTPSTTPAQ